MSYEIAVDRDLEDVIPIFQENRQKDLNELKAALSNKDKDKIQFIGHSLKGVGAGYGFVEITNIGREIEELAKAYNLNGVDQLILKLEDYLNHVKITYVDEE